MLTHFEFVDNNYDDKKIVIEITENTIDIAIFDIYSPDQINPPNRYASAVISRDDLYEQGLIISDIGLVPRTPKRRD